MDLPQVELMRRLRDMQELVDRTRLETEAAITASKRFLARTDVSDERCERIEHERNAAAVNALRRQVERALHGSRSH